MPKIRTKYEIFELLSNNREEVEIFKKQLSDFLNNTYR